jgi:hypothetical protein
MWFMIMVLTVGVPPGVSSALAAFDQGFLYLRDAGMESSGVDSQRDNTTGLEIITDGCETSASLEREIELWNTVMLKQWNSINTSETSFTISAGNEYLYYEGFLLFYANQSGRSGITIRPEELWSILNHALNNSSPATGQIHLEAWYPGLSNSVSTSVTANDSAMNTVQQLLQRGRETIL